MGVIPVTWPHLFVVLFFFFTDPTSKARGLRDPWVCVASPGENEQGVTPPLGPISVPCVSFPECSSRHSPQPDPGDSGDGDYDEGPEYLAIGNLGSRRVSQSSTHSSDQSEPQDQSQQQSLQQGSRILPPHRRSSFSEGQKGPGRGLRGHTRSFSDTGINTKLRSGKKTLTYVKNSALSNFLLSTCALTLLSSPQTAADVMERHIIALLVFEWSSLCHDNSFCFLNLDDFRSFCFPGCKTKKMLGIWVIYCVSTSLPAVDGNSLFLIPFWRVRTLSLKRLSV